MPYGAGGRRTKQMCPACDQELVTGPPTAYFTCEHCGTELDYTLHIRLKFL
jgi:predicted RNA-binding Zn-ribbon protein involved in translation (DUF1610 family)